MFSKSERTAGDATPDTSDGARPASPAKTPAGNPASNPASNPGATSSVISADLKITGNLESAGDIQIDGTVDGDVRSRSVTVGEGAKVTGAVIAETARICGTLSGQVRASSVIIAKTAKATGDIIHKTLSIEAGAFLEGQVKRLDAEPAKAAPKLAAGKPAQASSPAPAKAAGGS